MCVTVPAAYLSLVSLCDSPRICVSNMLKHLLVNHTCKSQTHTYIHTYTQCCVVRKFPQKKKKQKIPSRLALCEIRYLWFQWVCHVCACVWQHNEFHEMLYWIGGVRSIFQLFPAFPRISHTNNTHTYTDTYFWKAVSIISNSFLNKKSNSI